MPTLNPRMLVVRGIISIIFGFLAIAWPGPGLVAIALLFGAYAFVDGVLAIASAFQGGKRGWILPILEGIVGVTAGIVSIFWPAITLFVLSILTGVWALTTGLFELIAAFRLQDLLNRPAKGSRALLAIAGLLSVALGVYIFVQPAVGAIVLLTFISVYAMLFGILLINLGAGLSQKPEAHEMEERKAA